jgi:phosphate:Na+ symporter
MSKNWLLIGALALIGYGIWVSADLKVIAAGVAIFLFGMRFLEKGFTAFTGGTLEKLLKKSTSSLWKSHLFGIVSTSIMQSSSLVSVITISFLSAGLIDLFAGVGIIFGANIGTTTGAWLMAGFGMKVKISAYAMPMIIFGFILVFQKKKELKGLGNILAGLGFLFLGIHYMKEGFEAYKDTIDLAEYAVEGPMGLLLFSGLGVAATVVMQSSHATLMLIIAGLAAGQVTYENALALAIGANIGTTITAILGSLTANIAGKRLAMAHLVFNTVTALVAVVFMDQFRWAVDYIASNVGIAGDDWTLKLAVFHTIFNVVGVLIMMPFMRPLVNVLEKRIHLGQVARKEKAAGLRPMYLNDSALLFPDAAKEVLLKEASHLFDKSFEILAHALHLHRMDILMGRKLTDVVADARTPMDIDVVEHYRDSVKTLYAAIIAYITRASAEGGFTDAQLNQFYSVRLVARAIAENVKDVSAMAPNINTYMSSDNEHMRNEYDQLRVNIAAILRRVYRVRDTMDGAVIMVALAEMEEDIAASDVLANGTIDRLVREGSITPIMATSLMNDNAYASRISGRLLDIARRLASVENLQFMDAESEIRSFEEDKLNLSNATTLHD